MCAGAPVHYEQTVRESPTNEEHEEAVEDGRRRRLPPQLRQDAVARQDLLRQARGKARQQGLTSLLLVSSPASSLRTKWEDSTIAVTWSVFSVQLERL